MIEYSTFHLEGSLFSVLVAKGDWPTDVKGALEESIRKWKHLLSLCEAGRFASGNGSDTCALCRLFVLAKIGNECEGCPVAGSAPGRDGCWETPYTKYQAAIRRTDAEGAVKAAREEVAFLESLRRGCEPQ